MTDNTYGAFSILRGWPSGGALGLTIQEKANEELGEGMFAMAGESGWEKGGFATDGSENGKTVCFVLQANSLKPGKFDALLNSLIIELESSLFVAGSYTVDEAVTVADGKISKITTSEQTVGKVLSYDAAAGSLVILFKP